MGGVRGHRGIHAVFPVGMASRRAHDHAQIQHQQTEDTAAQETTWNLKHVRLGSAQVK